MLAEILQHLRLRPLPFAFPTRRLFGQQRHGAVYADREDVLEAFEVGVSAIMEHERAIAADAGRDRLAALGMQAHLARQSQELQRTFQIDGRRIHAARN